MRITKVYTRTGDGGTTRLAGGQELAKDDLRIEAYGTVDELNAAVGLARAYARPLRDLRPQARRLDRELHRVQNRLFDLGGLLATLPPDQARFTNMPRLAKTEVTHLERCMDACQRDLKPLAEFILPTGDPVTAALHLARTIGRRAERICVALQRRDPIDPMIVPYLNRLSDALFVWSRLANHQLGVAEVLWEPNRAASGTVKE